MSAIALPVTQNTDAWLEARFAGIGSSQAAAAVPNFLLRTNETSPFHLDLRTADSWEGSVSPRHIFR